ncbi:MAG: EamA family transporter [Polyangiaceae bacterium]
MLGPLLAFGSALSWSAANVAVQASSRRFGSWGALISAQLVGGALATVLALALEPWRPPELGLLPLVIGAGLAAALAYRGLFEALRGGQVGVVTPIISAWAIVSVGLGLVMGTPLSRLGALGVLLVALGNGLVARTGSGGQGTEEERSTSRAAIAWALGAALGFGTMVPLIDRLGTSLGRLWTIPWVWAAELLLIVPWVVARGAVQAWPRTLRDWWITARSGVFEVGGFVALTLALALSPLAVVSPISSLSTALSVLLGLVLLRERLRPVTLAGAALASVGVVVVNL